MAEQTIDQRFADLESRLARLEAEMAGAAETLNAIQRDWEVIAKNSRITAATVEALRTTINQIVLALSHKKNIRPI